MTLRKFYLGICLASFFCTLWIVACDDRSVGVGNCGKDSDCVSGVCRNGFCQGACKVDNDCPAGGSCQNGVCSSAGCKASTDCPAGSACVDGRCQSCQDDKQCPTGQLCLAGVCKEGNCREEGKLCPDGKICKNNKCTDCADDGSCGAGKICVGGVCKDGCRLDADCPQGQVCDPSDNLCKGCFDNKHCPGGICDIATKTCKECLTDGDCKDGLVCEENRCAPCRDNARCGAGKVCLSGRCKDGDCQQNSDCPAGQVCIANKCSGCQGDRDCPQGRICINSACIEGNCRDNKDCLDGQVCKNNKCDACTDDSQCATGQICVSGACRPGCRKDGDCPNGQKCDPAALTCKGCIQDSDCPAGQICRQNACTGCTVDADCPTGNLCINGLCKEGDCRQNSDCKDGKVCLQNKCSDCAQDSDCPTAQVCDPQNKRCRPGCRKNSDCPTGQVCDTTALVCVQCTDNAHCTGGQVCKSNRCSPCTADLDCGPNRLCNTSTGTCFSGNCRTNADCPSGFCFQNLCRTCPTLTFAGVGDPDTFVGGAYRHSISFTPSNAFPPPTAWRIVTGAPAWLQLTKTFESSIELSGTPTAAGQHSVEIEVSYAACKQIHTHVFRVWPKLTSLVSTFLPGSSAGVDVAVPNSTIAGGKAPYQCSFYRNNGGGTVPQGVTLDPTSCKTIGTPNATNKPGSYGFLVVVQDVFGQQVEIPVSYSTGACNNANFTITPNISTTPVYPSGGAYQFELRVNNIDWYFDAGRSACFYQVNLQLALGPLSGDQNLACSSILPVCVECNATEDFCVTGATGTCTPSKVIQMNQFIKIRAHTPIRPSGAPAFQSFEPSYIYSLNKTQTCHFDVLERN